MKCIFCNEIKEEQILLETASFKVIFDSDPIQLGHLLIISKSHADSIIDFTSETLLELIILEKKIVEALENNFNILGVSIIQNNGKVMDDGTHFHVHVVPRYTEDKFWDNQTVAKRNIDINHLKQILSYI
ncbi:HIT family protein [Carnobacterium sp.]|uniref:HIT family protein n=1 Tax=Carnobacterium sp. TaxID=48221 RepID=UPI00388DCA78